MDINNNNNKINTPIPVPNENLANNIQINGKKEIQKFVTLNIPSKQGVQPLINAVKKTSNRELYYNRNIKSESDLLKRNKPNKDEKKTSALSDDEWESAGNPLGFEKLGTVKAKKKVNVFTNLKEKELEEQIALLGTLDLNELSACDDSYDPNKKKTNIPQSNQSVGMNVINTKSGKENINFKATDLPSLVGLLAKSFVEDYSKNKTGNISMIVVLNNEA